MSKCKKCDICKNYYESLKIDYRLQFSKYQQLSTNFNEDYDICPECGIKLEKFLYINEDLIKESEE